MSDREEEGYEESQEDMEEDERSEEEEEDEEKQPDDAQEEDIDNTGDDEGDYAEEIRAVITKYNENPLELSTFSTGGEVEAGMGIPSVHVDGVGRIAYPLCNEQSVTLLGVSSQAPFGKGRETVVDVEVRRAWQIDSNIVHINPLWLANSLPKLVADCCTILGIDAVKANVRANLYKMLLYEEGGHFKKHRDTEKEPGMFGSLLIQLPADHEGGHLVVEHDKQKKRYQFDKESADKAYYAAFYADCEHTLEPVTKGLRLVLAFNLVRGVTNAASGRTLATTAAHRRGFEEVLQAAARAWCRDGNGVQKLALPLAHQYTHTNVSFAGLKGTDLSTLNLLQNVCDPETNEKVFRVYLALVTKHETGTEEEEYGYGGGEGGMSSDCDKEVDYETDTWVGPTGPVDLEGLSVCFEDELLTAPGEDTDEAAEEIFGSDPDREEREGYCGNYAGSLEYWYHSAVLVFWPAERDFDIKLAANPSQAVALLQGLDRASPDFAHKLTRLLAFLGTSGAGAWLPSAVLGLTQNVEQVRSVFTLCHKRSLAEADSAAVVAEIVKHGWAPLQEAVTKLLKSQSPAVMTVLLGLIHEQCSLLGPTTAPADAPFLVPLEAWEVLVQVLVTKVRESQPAAAATAASAAARYGYPYSYPGASSSSSGAVSASDQEWFKVSRFVTKHCALYDQVAIAVHLGTQLTLSSLNNILQQLQLSVTRGELSDGPFQAELRSCAVQQCVDKTQPAKDMTAVIEWVVQGAHADLLVRLRTKLRKLCNDPALFRALFALPCVLEELKKDTPMSAELESHVQARIAAVQPHTAVPPFSWRMPAGQIATSDSRVGPFLASDQQCVTLGGFSGIGHARNWASKYFQTGAVRAVPSGTGPRAVVTLTKSKSVHTAEVQRCAENAAELLRLRKLLRVRGREAPGLAPVGGPAGGASAAGVGVGVGGDGGGGTSSEAPPSKKAKVEEREIIVIDD